MSDPDPYDRVTWAHVVETFKGFGRWFKKKPSPESERREPAKPGPSKTAPKPALTTPRKQSQGGADILVIALAGAVGVAYLFRDQIRERWFPPAGSVEVAHSRYVGDTLHTCSEARVTFAVTDPDEGRRLRDNLRSNGLAFGALSGTAIPLASEVECEELHDQPALATCDLNQVHVGETGRRLVITGKVTAYTPTAASILRGDCEEYTSSGATLTGSRPSE